MKISPEKKLQMYLKRDSCDGRRWIHNKLGEHRRVRPLELSLFLKDGWIEGRMMNRDQNGRFTK